MNRQALHIATYAAGHGRSAVAFGRPGVLDIAAVFLVAVAFVVTLPLKAGMVLSEAVGRRLRAA